MHSELKKINKQKVGFFRFKQLNGKYLLTNEIGKYSFLTHRQFDLFLCGRMEKSAPDLYNELENNGFIKNKIDFDDFSWRYSSHNFFLGQGTSLHIVVVTLRCDHSCIYCQTSSSSLKAKELDMDINTAQKVVDIIFESPNRNITIEFQGGEPLVNFETLKFIVNYAIKKNKQMKKNLRFTLVSNFSFMNKKIINYLIGNNFSICTSLDGSERIHNKNRLIFGKKNSYKNTVRCLRVLKKEFKKGSLSFKPAALATIVRSCLSYPKEIVDEYVSLGLENIHLRPVSPFGTAGNLWKEISYSAEDFIIFYKQALDYILDLNIKGKKISEGFAKIFLTKILTDENPNYMDIRSPCGAGIGQLAYNFNGDVYTCDEGRMLSRIGDESFKIGNVKENTYKEIINNPTTKVICVASLLDNLPECYNCVYKPYCGVCPLYNHKKNSNVFKKSEFLCKVYGSILDYLFVKLQSDKMKNVFYGWLKR